MNKAREGNEQEKDFVREFNRGIYVNFAKQYFSSKNYIVCVHGEE